MTLPQFLEALKKTPRDWQRDELGRIRHCGECPITSLAKMPCAYADLVAMQFGINHELRDRIMVTADHAITHPKFNRDLRDKLLKACGLAGAAK